MKGKVSKKLAKILGFPSFGLLSHAHSSDGGHRFPDLVPGRKGRWTINVDSCLALPVAYPQVEE